MNEAAELLGVSRTKLYAMAAAGQLPGLIRFGSSLRVSAKVLAEYIEKEAAGASWQWQPTASEGERSEIRNGR
jgi:excisionase family DNA binding protein